MILTIIVLAAGCGTPTGPTEQENPGGGVIAWFNNLGATVDLYFPAEDSLVNYAYATGSCPNDVLDIGDGRIAILSSFDCLFQVFSLEATGGELFSISLPAGSNPYSMTMCSDKIWITLLNTSQVASFEPVQGASVTLYDVASNPTGIAASSDRIFIGHGNYPETGIIGGITVLEASKGDSIGFVDTPENTWCLRYFEETNIVHAMSTTYMDDGVISIIDPDAMSILTMIATGGTPGAPVRTGSLYASGDGWSSDAVYFYDETGMQSEWNTGFNVSGVAVMGDTLYMTDFSNDIVLISDWTQEVILDTLSTGDGPIGIISAVR